MRDEDKTREQLIAENEELRERVAGLEQALQENQSAATLLQVAPLGIHEIDTTGRITFVNVSQEAITGYTADELVGTYCWDHIEPGPATAALPSYLKRLVSEQPPPTPFCAKNVRKNGEVFDVRVDWNYKRDERGQVIGFVCIVSDITEPKRAEEAIQKAHDELERRVEERTAELAKANENLDIFRKFADTSTQGFSMADLDGHLIYLNPALCRMLGEERQEVWIGEHLSICYGEESNRRGKHEIEPALMREGYWQGELPMLSRQGKSILTWHNTFVIRDERGNPLRLAVVITDITERKQAEEALRQSYDELRAIYEGMVDGLNILDLETLKAVRVNSALCRMMGYSEEEALQLTQAQVHPPEALPKIVESMRAHVEGRASREIDMPHVRKDGSIIYADIGTSRITYNNRPCLMCFFHDTTERREAQEALKRERRSLEHMLQASDHERQLIAYDIHDGLAQELAGAIMQFQVYDCLKSSNPVEAQKAYDGGLSLLRRGHAETRRLIGGVRPPILDESGVVAAIAHLVHDPVFDQGPKVELHSKIAFHRLNPIVENVIYRIVQEGLTNARNYSKSDKILVSLKQRDDRLRIEIRDWGVGFDPKTVQEDRFGLEGIRERARLLGGNCSIKSKPGKRTSIVVELPVAEQEQEE